MFGANAGGIGIVVDRNEIRAAKYDNLRLGRQRKINCALQRDRPRGYWTEACGRPVVVANELRHVVVFACHVCAVVEHPASLGLYLSEG